MARHKTTPPKNPIDYTQPVAYDTDGRPLYAHPPSPEQLASVSKSGEKQPVHQVVHMTRALDPVAPVISDEVRARHEASRRKYRFLNLSEGEFVISDVQRHPIGIVFWVALPVLVTLLVLLGIPAYADYYNASDLVQGGGILDAQAFAALTLSGAVIVWLVSLAAIYIYRKNRFFLTNESVIQEIQLSLFAHKEQTVSLANIEDASYRKNSILEQLFDYGSIRLSTEGDETTYRLTYVSNPKRQIAILNNAVEAFKNGRPITSPDNS